MQEKRCADCGETKALDQFHRHSHHKDGRQGWCKECHNARARNWRAANPGYHQKRLGRDPDYFRRSRIKARYGLTWEQYQALQNQQAGRCAICQAPIPSPLVDHSHITGKVRGLLCRKCNTALGLLEHHEWLVAAWAYLMAHGEAPEVPREPFMPDSGMQGSQPA